MTESPFIEISIQTTSDSEKTPKEILTVIANRNKVSPYNTVSWKGNEANPILRLDYESYAALEESYKTGEDQMAKFLNLLEDEVFNVDELKGNFDLKDMGRNQWQTVSFEEMYLILKYRTNYKSPLRQNYKFSEYFIHFFQEHIMYEEVFDGFLIFYHRKEDYMNSNLNKLDPVELKQWLQAKNINFDTNFMKQLFDLI